MDNTLLAMSDFPQTDLGHLQQRLRIRLTSVELWPVMELGVAMLAQKSREVPADGYREHECNADPEGSYRRRPI